MEIKNVKNSCKTCQHRFDADYCKKCTHEHRLEDMYDPKEKPFIPKPIDWQYRSSIGRKQIREELHIPKCGDMPYSSPVKGRKIA